MALTSEVNGSAGFRQAQWRHMADRLEPVIGPRGVAALYGRALHLTAKSFPWLAAARVHADMATSLHELQICFQDRDTSVASAASHSLVDTFTGLLAVLVGKSLTEHLLDAAQNPLPHAPAGEPSQ